MTVFLLALAVVVFCVLAMSVAILFKKNGEFPKYDVGSNEQMQKMGIRCFKDEDALLHSKKCSGNYSEACRDCALRPTTK